MHATLKVPKGELTISGHVNVTVTVDPDRPMSVMAGDLTKLTVRDGGIEYNPLPPRPKRRFSLLNLLFGAPKPLPPLDVTVNVREGYNLTLQTSGNTTIGNTHGDVNIVGRGAKTAHEVGAVRSLRATIADHSRLTVGAVERCVLTTGRHSRVQFDDNERGINNLDATLGGSSTLDCLAELCNKTKLKLGVSTRANLKAVDGELDVVQESGSQLAVPAGQLKVLDISSNGGTFYGEALVAQLLLGHLRRSSMHMQRVIGEVSVELTDTVVTMGDVGEITAYIVAQGRSKLAAQGTVDKGSIQLSDGATTVFTAYGNEVKTTTDATSHICIHRP